MEEAVQPWTSRPLPPLWKWPRACATAPNQATKAWHRNLYGSEPIHGRLKHPQPSQKETTKLERLNIWPDRAATPILTQTHRNEHKFRPCNPIIQTQRYKHGGDAKNELSMQNKFAERSTHAKTSYMGTTIPCVTPKKPGPRQPRRNTRARKHLTRQFLFKLSKQ